jgi:NitT/TauT family transport system substrate-binding protein
MKVSDHRLNRRTLLKSAGAAGSLALVGGRSWAQAGSLAVGTASISLQYAPLYVAKKNGYFSENGLEVEIINTQSGPRTRQALAAGQLLVAMTSVGDSVALTIAGKPAAIITGIDHKMAWANVLVRKEDVDSGVIKNLKDLSGRPIAVTQPKSAAWSTMVHIAKQAQLEIEPQFQSLGDLAAMLAALRSKRVDATIATAEMVNQALDAGWGVPIFSGQDSAQWEALLGGDIPGVCGFALKEATEAEKDKLQAFVAGITKGSDFVFANTPATIAGLLHDEYFTSFELPALERAAAFYQSAIWSKDNVVSEEEYKRVLEVFGSDRMFAESDLGNPGVAYANAVDMQFVKKARGL